MHQLTRQSATSVLQRPLLDSLCKKSKQLRSAMMAGASSLGLDFACDEGEGYQPEPLERLNWNLNDIEELWTAIMENVGMERSQHLEQQSYAKVNDEYLLGCMMTVRALTDTLNILFKAFTEANINGDMHDQMRKTAELISSLTSTLRKYRSTDPEFSQARELYGKVDRISIEIPPDRSNVSKNSTAATPGEDYNMKRHQLALELTNQLKLNIKHTKNEMQGGSCTPVQQEKRNYEQHISELKEQIHRMESTLEQNNQEFAEEVQKYNSILYEQQQELRNCQTKFLQFEESIHQLQSTVVRLREEKHRDELLIEYILRIFRNMSKKLRQYERDLGIPVSGTTTLGTSTFPSPRSQMGSTISGMFLSPSPVRSTFGGMRGYPNRGHLS